MISAVILARDEENSIKSAIENVSFCEEVIVVDNGSKDKTATIAKNEGAQVVSDLHEDFSIRRNAAMKLAKYDWVLFIDADERVPKDLAKEIQHVVASPYPAAYYIRRKDIFWGKPAIRGEVKNAYKQGFIRLMKKGSGHWRGKVHETFETTEAVGTLHTPLEHYAHEGISDFLYAVNEYSSLRADELFEEGSHTNWFDITFTPAVKFIYTYVLLRGFRDGAVGFVYSFMMSFHSFLVRGKLYLKQSGAKV